MRDTILRDYVIFHDKKMVYRVSGKKLSLTLNANISAITWSIFTPFFFTSGVKFNSKTFLFSSLWPKNASKCLKLKFFGKMLIIGQNLEVF